MPSQFFGLTIAGSGITAYQAAINATANNVANVQKEGYSRQVANINSADALRVNTRYGSIGSGVTTESIKQLRNEYYDRKYWENQSRVGYYEDKLYYMSQIEEYFIDDDTITGFTALMTDMDNSLNELKGNNADETERKAFISKCKSLTNYFNNVANELQSLQSGINDQIKTTVENVNSILQKISLLNKEINVIEIQGGYANELRDERNLLADELSSIMPVEISEVEIVNSNDPDMYLGGHDYTIKIQGQYLVDGYEFYELECRAREELKNQSDTTGLYDIYWKNTGVSFSPYSNAMDGSLKALFEMRDGNNRANFQGDTGTATLDKTSYDLKVKDFDPALLENLKNTGKVIIGSTEYEYDSFEVSGSTLNFHIVDGKNSLEGSTGQVQVDGVAGFTGNIEDNGIKKDATSYFLSVENFNEKSVFDLNMPESGTVNVNNRDYHYDGFSYTTKLSEDGSEEMIEFIFHIDDGDTYLENSTTKPLRMGDSVDCLGIPYYQNQLNAFLRSYTQKFNNIEESGLTLDEKEMGAFFVSSDRMTGDEIDFSDYSDTYKAYLKVLNSETATPTEKDEAAKHTYTFGALESDTDPNTSKSNTYYKMTALKAGIADASLKDANRFSTSAGNIVKDKDGNVVTDASGNPVRRLDDGVDQADLTEKLLDLYDNVTIVRGTKAKDFLQCIIDDVSVDTEETKTFVNNYTALKNSIQTQRDSVSGVDQDEEALDLIKFQNAYNLSSKVIQVLTEIYDRLILETGV